MPPENTQGGRSRIKREKHTVEAMVHIYCTDHHDKGETLCVECSELLEYAKRRLDTCPFQEAKPACNHCEVHCYSAEMRNRVKVVMGYAGPRMAYRYPLLSFQHLLDKFRKVPSISLLRQKKK